MATKNGAARSRIVLKYRECQRNYAAPLMRYIVDGCGDFIPAREDGTSESLICGACGCHRSFHRREELEFPVCRRPPLRLSLIRHRVVPPPPPSSSQPQPEPAVAPHGARGALVDPSPNEVRSEQPGVGEIEEKRSLPLLFLYDMSLLSHMHGVICGACGCHRSFYRKEELKLPIRPRLPPRLSLIRHPVVPPPPQPQSEQPVAARGARSVLADPSPDEMRSKPPDVREIEEKVGTKKKERTKLSWT
ncbi:hypothetical protein F0562_020272 [Nyssa sinensis]|uniref:ZF-HD dimerization-type domain-containing protein n=1 Tax=Nyssa sinensis TaxID=561372 RepID=A0A5J5BRH5_9ASTE|nr:hypothetical protein F0562_020272 [Nyssa sinensis]